MHPYFFSVLHLIEPTRAFSTNTTGTGCLSSDAISCHYRSVWSLLASCGLTLSICVWHATHPALPLPHFRRIHVVLYQLSLMLLAFFTPELLIMAAFDEWREAKRITKRVHARGHKWWTMTHSHFVLIGGFALCDGTGIKEIDIHKFLSLLEDGDIINPVITEDDIKDKSLPDSLAQAVLVAQLSWFTAQMVVRLVNHLSLTLLELDTACMAVLTLPLVFFWREKPRCPGRPHIFYTHNVDNLNSEETLQDGYVLKKSLDHSTIRTCRSWQDLLAPADVHTSSDILFLLTWSVFGTLHAIAWNYEFPTEIEKTMWRVSSLILAGTPVICGVMLTAMDFNVIHVPRFVDRFLSVLQTLLLITDIISRLLLVGLMLASLRSLPSSAYQTIPWSSYVPHL